MAERRRSGGRSSSSGSRSSRSRPAQDEALSHHGSRVGEHGLKPSDVDAMGQDKRRQVVGHSYGPSRRSQLMFFVAVGVALLVLVGGWTLLIGIFDQPPDHFPARAPWSTTASSPELRAEQSAKPNAVDTPCGEPGNVYPVPPASPCTHPTPGATPQSLSGQ